MEIVAGIVIVALLWHFVLRHLVTGYRQEMARQASKGGAARQSGSGGSASFHWPPLGDYDFEAVGESHYQRELAQLAGPHGTEGASVECVAKLVPENDNPHDPKAVAVLINGVAVGYMSRDDARKFRRRLKGKGMADKATTCNALIAGGGTRRDGEKLYYGVRLDLKPFE